MKFNTKKSLGQHFLNSPVVPEWMCDVGDVSVGDMVVEIGPGTGVLTKALLERGATVIALEADQRAITVLEERFAHEIASGTLVIKHVDVREFTLSDLALPDHSFKVVANIPYYLSGLLFRSCLSEAVQPSDLVFLVQKEVAKRITTDISRGEKESLLSLSVKVYGEPAYVKTVSRGHFTPSPKVDSGIIAVRNISRAQLDGVAATDFFAVLHLGFGQKRKQLLGNLAVSYPRETLEAVFSTLSISLTTRAEDLPLPTWIALVKALSTA